MKVTGRPQFSVWHRWPAPSAVNLHPGIAGRVSMREWVGGIQHELVERRDPAPARDAGNDRRTITQRGDLLNPRIEGGPDKRFVPKQLAWRDLAARVQHREPGRCSRTTRRTVNPPR